MSRVFQSAWRDEHAATPYPFAASAGLTADDGAVLPADLFLDASLWPAGAVAGLYLRQVVVAHDLVTLIVADPESTNRATASFDPTDPPDALELTDAYDRPAGILVSERLRLSAFQGWGDGVHQFQPEQTAFAATVHVPMPAGGVTGVLLDDGTLLSGDVWLVGGDGVVLTTTTLDLPATRRREAQTVPLVAIHVVGDPLFRRRLCDDGNLFTPPRFLRVLRVTDGVTTADLTPDDDGHVHLVVNNSRAIDTVLRLTPTGEGLQLGAVGDVMGD
jgi:hypothetical protein